MKETPLARDPLDKDPLQRDALLDRDTLMVTDSPRQRPPPGQRPPLIETSQMECPPSQRPRHPCGQTNTCENITFANSVITESGNNLLNTLCINCLTVEVCFVRLSLFLCVSVVMCMSLYRQLLH